MNHQPEYAKITRLQNRISARKGLIGCGEEFSAALHNSGKLVYVGTDRWGQKEAREWSNILYLTCGRDHIITLMEDGTLRMAGRGHVSEEQLGMISCARTVSTGGTHVAVLLGNGHTVAIGNNRHGQCKTANWPAVTDVVCGRNFTLGLTESGQVLISGGTGSLRYTVRAWRNIAGIFTDYTGRNVYAINTDGKLISNTRLPRKVEKWKNLVSIAACGDAIWGVTANGALLSTEETVHSLSTVKHYIACAVTQNHVIALTRDGQVLSAGKNDFGQCNTTRFGAIYSDYDEFVFDRNTHLESMTEQDYRYQVRLADSFRYKKHLACGGHITVCINAEGRVLTTAEYTQSEDWLRVRAVSCGNAHVLALHENGTVSADGNPVDGSTDVSAWRNVKNIEAAKYHSIGLTEDGTVYFCGRNDCGQGDVTEWSQIRKIKTTDTYTVGVTYEGKLKIAGRPPFDVSQIDESWNHPVDVVASPTHLACLYADGTVKNTTPIFSEDDEHPYILDTSHWRGVRAIAAGHYMTLGLCFGGHVLATGNNDDGQCGTSEWTHVVDIGCGDRYAAGLTADGRILVAGELKKSNRSAELMRIADISRWQDVIALRCGDRHLVTMNESGQILAEGEDEDRQCSGTAHFAIFRDVRQLYGYGRYNRQIEQEIQAQRVSSEPQTEPRVSLMARLSLPEAAALMKGKIAVGMAHTIMMDEWGQVHTEGANDCGQTNLNDYVSVCQVAAGPYRSAVIMEDGHIEMSGRNTVGQSDAITLNQILEPTTTIEIPYTWKQVACGDSHTAAVRSDGRVFAVGADSDGRCRTEAWQDVREVACGIRHTVAVRGDGTCLATGENRYGQCNVADWQNVQTVAAGEFHTVALLPDGHVTAVGDNRKGQCNLSDLTDIMAIACMPEATLCVRTDGRVVIRGGSGEANAAVEALRDVVALATCEHRIAALTIHGQLVQIPS